MGVLLVSILFHKIHGTSNVTYKFVVECWVEKSMNKSKMVKVVQTDIKFVTTSDALHLKDCWIENKITNGSSTVTLLSNKRDSSKLAPLFNVSVNPSVSIFMPILDKIKVYDDVTIARVIQKIDSAMGKLESESGEWGHGKNSVVIFGCLLVSTVAIIAVFLSTRFRKKRCLILFSTNILAVTDENVESYFFHSIAPPESARVVM